MGVFKNGPVPTTALVTSTFEAQEAGLRSSPHRGVDFGVPSGTAGHQVLSQVLSTHRSSAPSEAPTLMDITVASALRFMRSATVRWWR